MNRNRCLAVLLLLLLAFPLSALGSPAGTDVTAFLTNLNAEVRQDSFLVSEGGTLTQDPVEVRFSFGVPVAGDEPVPVHPVRKGDWAEFELSSGFVLNSGTFFELKDGDTLIGHVSIRTETVGGIKKVFARVDFDGDEDVYNGESFALSAFFNAEFAYDGSGSSGGAGDYPVAILSKTYTVTIPPGEIVYTLDKSGTVNLADRTFTWTAVVDAVRDGAHIDLDGYTFEDDLSLAGTDASNFLITPWNPPDPAPIPTINGNKISYIFPAGIIGPKTITYQTSIPDGMYFSQDDVTAQNEARLLDSTTTEVKFDSAVLTFNPGWISKSGKPGNEGTPALYNSIDRTLTWTIVANSRGLPLEGVVITDVLPAGLTWQSASLQKRVGTDWVPATPTFPTEPASGQYAMGNINTPVLLTIVARVDNPDPASPYTASVTTYTNAASISWTGAGVPADGVGTGGVGVGVGFNPVIKAGTVNDVRDGTIRWTVQVNLKDQDIPNLKVYDLLVYGTSWDPGSVSGAPAGLSLGSLTPQYNQRYSTHVYKDSWLSVQVYPLYQGTEQIADLIEATGLSTTDLNTFVFTSQIVNPNLFAGNAKNDVYNTATLFSGTTKLNEATASAEYNGMVLKKSMLDRNAAAAPLDGANANSVTTDLAEGFNYVDKSVVFRLNVNVNGMNFSNATDENGVKPGRVTITDTLPAGWQFAEVTPGKTYALLQGIGVTPTGNILVGSPPFEASPADFTAVLAGGTATFTFDNLAVRYVILLRAKPTDAEALILFNGNKTPPHHRGQYGDNEDGQLGRIQRIQHAERQRDQQCPEQIGCYQRNGWLGHLDAGLQAL